jgi:hypothetical protein
LYDPEAYNLVFILLTKSEHTDKGHNIFCLYKEGRIKTSKQYILTRGEGGLQISALRIFVDSLQCLQNGFPVSEHAIGQEKRVQEVDA